MAANDPSSRPAGHALIIAQPDLFPELTHHLQQLGLPSTPVADPYTAFTELLRRPLVYRILIVSLQSLYQEELKIIPVIKNRLPHVEIYLTHLRPNQSAQSLGAHGLLTDLGFQPKATPNLTTTPPPVAPLIKPDLSESEPLLTIEELRALLDDQPTLPPAVGGE